MMIKFVRVYYSNNLNRWSQSMKTFMLYVTDTYNSIRQVGSQDRIASDSYPNQQYI